MKLALIHTSPTLTPLFGGLCTQYMPEVRVFHMVDESLIRNTIENGSLQRGTMRRLIHTIESAFEAGADGALVTCSSIGPGVKIAQSLFDLPVIRVDEAMAEAAIGYGSRIGVIATLSTTLDPTISLIQEKAELLGAQIEIVSSLCNGAFEAVLAGDTATHDRILGLALIEDMPNVDVIVLAQASMARVVASLPAGALKTPVLSSPELAVLHTRELLLGLPWVHKG